MSDSVQKRGNPKGGIKKRPTRKITRDNAMELFEQARKKLVDDCEAAGARFKETPTKETSNAFWNTVTSVMDFDQFTESCTEEPSEEGAKKLVARCAAVLKEEVDV